MKEPKKLAIANIPTPIQQKEFNGCKFWVKRDDLTGVELSGNKVRKLEYLLADALKEKADYVFTCGGEQSNHCRATAIAAATVGIKTKLFLWGMDRKNASGNLFFDKLVGSEINYVSKDEYFNISQIMESEKEKLKKKGKKVYIIPEGGSSELGIWGYINFVKELKDKMGNRRIKGIITAAGSGGTTAGLMIGAFLYNLPLKIFAVNVLYDKATIENKIFTLLERAVRKYKLKLKIDNSVLEILDGYSEEGYKKIEDKKVEVIVEFFKQSGMLLDPAYTGKAFYAFNENFLIGKKSSSVIFTHTGGLFGVFNKSKQYLAAVS